MKINFLLTGEGSSDLQLQSHIENVLICEGFTEVHSSAPDLGALCPKVGNTVREKLQAVIKYFPEVDLIFVHRDADGAGIAARTTEIMDGGVDIVGAERIIPIVPIRMLEAWLLADIEAIKAIAGNSDPQFTINCVPKLRQIENIAAAKELLLTALCEASQTQGGRLTKFKKRFPEMRARLASSLDPDGPVKELSSYKAFRAHVSRFAQARLNAIKEQRPPNAQ